MRITGFTTKYYFEFAKFDNPSKELSNNATTLVQRVNALLFDITTLTGMAIDCIATSTIRTSERNKKIGGAKNSFHTIGSAIDILDKDGKLAKAILSNQDLLKKHKLCFENPQYTKGWVHLDIGTRGGEYRMFTPY